MKLVKKSILNYRLLVSIIIAPVILFMSVNALYSQDKFDKARLEFMEPDLDFNKLPEAEKEYLKPLEQFRQEYATVNVYDSVKNVPVDPHKGFRFIVMGDNKMSTTVFPLLLGQVNMEGAVFAFNCGDLVTRGTVEQWADYYIPTLRRYADIPVFQILGNHDQGKDRNQNEFRYLFGNPDYFFDYGGCRFVVIENTVGRNLKKLNGKSAYGLSEQQLNWLDRILGEAIGMRKFVFAHIPPSNIEKYNTKGFKLGAEKFTNIMSKHHVFGVYFAHVHAYSTALRKGVLYTTTGGAGASLKKRYGKAGEFNHYIVVTVTPEGVSQEIVKLEWTRSGPGNEYHEWTADYYKKRWKDQYREKVKEAIQREAMQKIEEIEFRLQ